MDEQYRYFFIDLQLFADDGMGEKTEKATPRRREEARKKGQVFKSTDLNSAIILIAGSVASFVALPYMIENLQAFTALYILERTQQDFSNDYVYLLLLEGLFVMGKMIFPIFAATFTTALLITYLQVGFVFSGESLTPKLERLNPVEGFKRIFSKRALVELLKSLLKVIVTGYIVYSVMSKHFFLFPRFVDMELIACLQALSSIVFEMAMKVGLVFINIGIIDYIFQWYEHEKSLKMSKHEIKQEYKQTEGDPQLKSRQRRIQREIAMQRMMAEVPKADVVITNPTHFAVVLKYEASKMEAPVLVAKGKDFMALKIKEVAKIHEVVIVENPLLARTLYYNAEIGDPVPEELYQAVAEVLAFVYKQKKRVV
ncbi:MAG: flagellar biosynthesis protein FlhB [Syntrophomonas sp.]|uniref:flagellar biosynthesis protein FlhB n=1 Tax=Syntrophomonas sp. TaxID=2053627 RepID=UPI002626E413|nr:flagellar biosynthesis protein FlhB [Syntrophomonas sp.]MDD4627359.1 flagellar biosynthesis protein FlhB [Syntrophomonas sp.]